MVTDRFTQLTTYLVPAAVALGGVALGALMQRVGLHQLARLARRSAWRYDDALVEALHGPVVAWFTLAGLSAAAGLLELPARIDRVAGQTLLVLTILSATWAVVRFVVRALRAGASEGALPGVSLIANVAAAAVWVVGGLVVLDKLGISIAPIVTALGVGGLAVALALQDTLASLFAGLRILAAGKIRPGDFVRLDSGEEGFVQDITWAQTTIRQLPNNLVLIPNAKLATAITSNFSFPDPEQGVVVKVGVAYGSDLERVERVTVEVAREVQREVAGAVPTFEPFVRFNAFGESSVDFSVILRAARYEERFVPVHEFVKRLHARFQEEGIEIPFPIRTVHLKRDGEAAQPPR